MEDMVENFQGVDTALAKFEKEMKAQGLWDSVAVVQASDFGRTLKINGDGTGHGWGGNYFIAGGAVNGGQILGDYPDDLTDEGTQILGGSKGGRVIPSTSWDQIWNGIAEWYGVDDAQLDRELYSALTAALLQYTRNVLSTRAMAEYVLRTMYTYGKGHVPAVVTKVFYLTHQDHDMDKGDYMTGENISIIYVYVNNVYE